MPVRPAPARLALRLISRLLRTCLMVVLAAAGTTLLVRYAPGYLSDAREMDARYAGVARADISSHDGSAAQLLVRELRGWAHGDLGQSRQYDVPVRVLIDDRLTVTGMLLLRAIAAAWLIAFLAAFISGSRQRPSLLWQLPSTLLLAIPTAALATLCLLTDKGGPVFVLTVLLAVRDYKFIDRAVRAAWSDPYLMQARAQGISTRRLLLAYTLPAIAPQLAGLATLSIVTSLSAIVPVEVLFNVPGIGGLAWSAALNRDLPVLLAVTVLMAITVSAAVTLTGSQDSQATQRLSAETA